MRQLFVALFLAAGTCRQQGSPTPAPPDPVPYPIPDGGDDDAGDPTPAPTSTAIPDSTCEAVIDHLESLECPPAEGHAVFLTKCAGFSSSALSCLLATDTCAIARGCLER